MAIEATGQARPPSWQILYVSALMEGDREKVPVLIVEAERAIVARARELFGTQGDNVEEQESLDDALYALHALKSCLTTHGHFAEAA
jgi:hypothetical protein